LNVQQKALEHAVTVSIAVESLAQDLKNKDLQNLKSTEMEDDSFLQSKENKQLENQTKETKQPETQTKENRSQSIEKTKSNGIGKTKTNGIGKIGKTKTN